MLTARILRRLLCLEVGRLPITRQPSLEKTIYLTFDDGPHQVHSNKIMDVLARYDIKATFFLIGLNIEKDLDTAKRMVSEGHVLGNHTHSHKLFTSIPKAERIVEVEKCQQRIDCLQDPQIRIFRPPQGLINPLDVVYLARQNFKIMLWTSDSMDHLIAGDIEFRLRVLSKRYNVLLFHDDNDFCVGPLENLIPVWIEQGFRFAVPTH